MGFAMELAAARSCHCLAARRQARALTRFYEARLRPHGLRATQFSVLAALHLKGPTPLGELAELLGLERTSLSRSVGVLEERGWLQERSTGDGRMRLLGITAAGRRRLKSAFPAWKKAQEEVDRLGLDAVERWIKRHEG